MFGFVCFFQLTDSTLGFIKNVWKICIHVVHFVFGFSKTKEKTHTVTILTIVEISCVHLFIPTKNGRSHVLFIFQSQPVANVLTGCWRTLEPVAKLGKQIPPFSGAGPGNGCQGTPECRCQSGGDGVVLEADEKNVSVCSEDVNPRLPPPIK